MVLFWLSIILFESFNCFSRLFIWVVWFLIWVSRSLTLFCESFKSFCSFVLFALAWANCCCSWVLLFFVSFNCFSKSLIALSCCAILFCAAVRLALASFSWFCNCCFSLVKLFTWLDSFVLLSFRSFICFSRFVILFCACVNCCWALSSCLSRLFFVLFSCVNCSASCVLLAFAWVNLSFKSLICCVWLFTCFSKSEILLFCWVIVFCACDNSSWIMPNCSDNRFLSFVRFVTVCSRVSIWVSALSNWVCNWLLASFSWLIVSVLLFIVSSKSSINSSYSWILSSSSFMYSSCDASLTSTTSVLELESYSSSASKLTDTFNNPLSVGVWLIINSPFSSVCWLVVSSPIVTVTGALIIASLLSSSITLIVMSNASSTWASVAVISTCVGVNVDESSANVIWISQWEVSRYLKSLTYFKSRFTVSPTLYPYLDSSSFPILSSESGPDCML